MQITQNTIVTLEYTVKDTDGELIDEGKEPLTYVHGGYENIFQPVEDALEGKQAGDAFRVEIRACDAFGDYDEELLVVESLKELPEDVAVGMQIEGYAESDPEDVILYTVTEIKEDQAVLDGNHPLAGLDLVFEGTVKEVVPSDEETIRKLLEHSHHH